MPRWRLAALRRPLAVSGLFLLLSLCHGVVIAGASGAIGPAAEPVEFAAHDQAPAHGVDCAADLDAAAPSAAGNRVAWTGVPFAPLGPGSAWAPPAVSPRGTVAIDPPAVRRALLQIFLI